MSIPKDPVILLGYVNTQLRDNYPSLDELCLALDEDRTLLTDKLNAIGYYYDEDSNQFV